MAVAPSDRGLGPGLFAVAIALAEDDSIQISPHGELDLATAPELQVQLDRFLSAGAARTVTLDLSGLTFIDSAGIRAVVDARRQSGRNHSTLRLLKASPEIMNVLRLAGLLDELKFEN